MYLLAILSAGADVMGRSRLANVASKGLKRSQPLNYKFLTLYHATIQ